MRVLAPSGTETQGLGAVVWVHCARLGFAQLPRQDDGPPIEAARWLRSPTWSLSRSSHTRCRIARLAAAHNEDEWLSRTSTRLTARPTVRLAPLAPHQSRVRSHLLTAATDQETFAAQLERINGHVLDRARSLPDLPVTSTKDAIEHALEVLPDGLPAEGLGLEGACRPLVAVKRIQAYPAFPQRRRRTFSRPSLPLSRPDRPALAALRSLRAASRPLHSSPTCS